MQSASALLVHHTVATLCNFKCQAVVKLSTIKVGEGLYHCAVSCACVKSAARHGKEFIFNFDITFFGVF